MRRILLTAAALVALLSARRDSTRAEEPDDEPAESEAALNVASPTLGGMQFWSDELVFHEWRIQRQVTTGHCRLLDDRNVRQAWGTYEACAARLDELKRERSLAALPNRVVILLHGLGRTRGSMKPLGEYLQARDMESVRVGYCSTRAGIDDHAQSLARVVSRLEGVDEVDFVAHSLGNLVIRRYLAMRAEDPRLDKAPRVRRIVMLGPPNHGAQRGRLWDESPWAGGAYRAVMGEVGVQLASNWETIEKRLATPACEFGIVAGGRGDGQGWHEKLEGDDDGTVTVAEARLDGATDFVVVPVRHTFLPSDKLVFERTLQFLEAGRFANDESARASVPDSKPDSE